MNKPVDIPFPEHEATWQRGKKGHKKRLVATSTHELPLTSTHVTGVLTAGNIDVREMPQQGPDASHPPTISMRMEIRALTEKKARAKLAKQRKGITVASTPEGVTILDTRPIKTKENRTLAESLKLFGKLMVKKSSHPVELGLNNPKIDVFVQAPDADVQYDLRTVFGDISVVRAKGDDVSTFITGLGTLRTEGFTGNLSLKDELGHIYTTQTKGNLIAKAQLGNVTVQDTTGDVQAQSNLGQISLKEIIGDVHATSTIGSIIANTITGDISTQTDVGTIQLSEIYGKVAAHTKQGQVIASGIDGTVHAGSESGDVIFCNTTFHGPDNSMTAGRNIGVETTNEDLGIQAVVDTGQFAVSDGVQVDGSAALPTGRTFRAHIGPEVSTDLLTLQAKTGMVHVAKKAH